MAQAQVERPNILIIWGDDIGMWNISAYHRGMMGGSTPNIDRIAKEGMIFHVARGFDEWQENRSWVFGPAKILTTQFFQTFKDYPPRQASFGLDVDELMRLSMTPVQR